MTDYLVQCGNFSVMILSKQIEYMFNKSISEEFRDACEELKKLSREVVAACIGMLHAVHEQSRIGDTIEVIPTDGGKIAYLNTEYIMKINQSLGLVNKVESNDEN